MNDQIILILVGLIVLPASVVAIYVLPFYFMAKIHRREIEQRQLDAQANEVKEAGK